jgi:hypothetical protein
MSLQSLQEQHRFNCEYSDIALRMQQLLIPPKITVSCQDALQRPTQSFGLLPTGRLLVMSLCVISCVFSRTGESGLKQRTANIAPVIQEITSLVWWKIWRVSWYQTSQTGWLPGNRIVIMMKRTSTVSQSNPDRRIASSMTRPVLNIVYRGVILASYLCFGR